MTILEFIDLAANLVPVGVFLPGSGHTAGSCVNQVGGRAHEAHSP